MAQLRLTAVGTPAIEDFTGYAGSGIASVPAAGQLDATTWRVTGLSAGTTTFSGSYSGGDYSRGASAGGETTGGLYAFSAQGSNNPALGVQPTSADFTPGSIVLRVQNNTGAAFGSLGVSLQACFFNDQARSTSLILEASPDDVTYARIALSIESPVAADTNPAWRCQLLAGTAAGLNLANGAFYYVRIRSIDAGGSGSRDEVAIDDVSVTPRLGAATDGGVRPDGSRRDAPTGDALRADGSARESGMHDGSTPDGAKLDGAAIDGSVADASEASDGSDSSVDTASTPQDLGASRDSGSAGGSGDDGGCCAIGASAPGSAAPLSLLLLLLVLVRPRRRRR